VYAVNGTNGVTVGTIAEFVIYINLLTFPVSAIGWTAGMIQRAAASQKRLNEFLQTEPTIRNSQSPKKIRVEGDIVFDNVSFTYPNTGIEALKDFNLHIRKGQKIAIIGHTGSGKTTIAQLLLRMYDPSEGLIKVDGENLKDLDLESLRNQLSYVPQDVFLFSDTIANNISFGYDRQVARELVEQAARYASIEKEINSFRDKFETVVGERGVTLSGGQKQRISIARALLKDPGLIIFDDCLSAVDARTEREILGNLRMYLENKTAIIITHRIFTLFDFDQVIVLEEGRMIEAGTPQELMDKRGHYYELYLAQNQKENESMEG
jgi:ATP-binding cassette subfamily B protein